MLYSVKAGWRVEDERTHFWCVVGFGEQGATEVASLMNKYRWRICEPGRDELAKSNIRSPVATEVPDREIMPKLVGREGLVPKK